MATRLRLYRSEDARALLAITRAAIIELGPRAYSDEQVAAWAARHNDPGRFAAAHQAGAYIAIACDEADQPLAYGLGKWDDAGALHCDMLYCAPDFAGRGLADALIEDAVKTADARRAPRIYTEASALARPAFKRAGFIVETRRDFSIEHAGKNVPIFNFAMQKVLR